MCLGSKGWHSGESTRLSPMWPGFKSRRRRHVWVEFVVGFLPCSERFFSGYSGFPLSSKTNISKFQFDQESGRRRTTMWMFYLQIVIYFILFIYLFIYVNEKQHQCDNCDKSFHSNPDLKRHEQQVQEKRAAQREYQCSACGETFYNLAPFRAHQKTAHSKPFSTVK